MTDPSRILLIRPSALGDVCRTVPVLAALRARYPKAQIDWMVQKGFEDAILHHPALSNTVLFERDELGKELRKGKIGRTRRFLKRLRESGYEVVVDAQGLARSGVFMRATRAKRRIGYRQAQELGWVAANERVDAPRELHTVDRMLLLAKQAGADITNPDMALYADPEAVSQVVIEYPEKYAVIAPTSRWASKRWTDARFAEVTQRILDENLVDRVVLVGAPGERHQCRKTLNAAKFLPRVTDRIGSTSIAQLMALISRASLVVANDSAAVHMAVGFDRPTVALYGPTDTSRVGPYERESEVIQHVQPSEALDHKVDDNRALMERITVDEVYDACVGRLANTTG